MENLNIQKAFELAWKASGKNTLRFMNELKRFEQQVLVKICNGNRMVNESECEVKYRMIGALYGQHTLNYDIRMTDGYNIWYDDEQGNRVCKPIGHMLPIETLLLAVAVNTNNWSEEKH
jgi:hypothetical protein